MTDYTADWTALPTRESADSRLHQGSARRPSLSLIVQARHLCGPVVLSGVLDICVLANSASPRARAITQSHIRLWAQSNLRNFTRTLAIARLVLGVQLQNCSAHRLRTTVPRPHSHATAPLYRSRTHTRPRNRRSLRARQPRHSSLTPVLPHLPEVT